MASMITVKSNIKLVAGIIQEKLDKLKDKEYLLRPVAFDAIDMMTKRIHVDGKASDGNQIGTYSKGYMAIRTGNFQNSEKFSKGARKGQNKNAGIVTKKKVQLFGTTQNVFADVTPLNQKRVSYNRSSDTKVIISLTRQLENDWSVIATQKGYGIGFLNPHNFDKSQWVQITYKKRIFDLTTGEYQHAIDRINELTSEAIK